MHQCEICAYDPALNFTYKDRAQYVEHMEMVHNVRFDQETGKSLKSAKPWLPPGSKAEDDKNLR